MKMPNKHPPSYLRLVIEDLLISLGLIVFLAAAFSLLDYLLFAALWGF
jgi:hypothetical protein